MPNAETLTRWIVCWALGAGAATAATEAPRPTAWKTETELDRQLDAAVGITWASSPLRPALVSLAQSQGVAVFLDRRVDPDQEVDFSIRDLPLRDLFQSLADHLALGTCRVGSVIYLGPKRTAAVLGTLAALKQEQLQQLPAAIRGRVTRVQSWQWPELTTPRQLLEQLTQEAGLPMEGPVPIPHDLWPAVDLPPLNFAERLSLLLAGFALTFDCPDEGRVLRLLPMPPTARLERTYAVSSQQTAVLQELARRFPDARITRRAGGVTVAGSLDAHETLQRLLKGRRPATPGPAKPAPESTVRYSLKIENQPVGAIAEALAKRLDRKIEFAPETRGRLDQLISFEVTAVPVDELLKALLAPAGLTYRLEASTLRISVAEPPP